MVLGSNFSHTCSSSLRQIVGEMFIRKLEISCSKADTTLSSVTRSSHPYTQEQLFMCLLICIMNLIVLVSIIVSTYNVLNQRMAFSIACMALSTVRLALALSLFYAFAF